MTSAPPDPVATELYVNHLMSMREAGPTEYRPPPKQKWWKMFAACAMIPGLSGSDKAVLAALLDFANTTTGRCDPAEATIARKLNMPLRTVERSIARLIRAGWIARLRRGRVSRRGRSSNAYGINWLRIETVFDQYKANSKPLRNLSETPSNSGN